MSSEDNVIKAFTEAVQIQWEETKVLGNEGWPEEMTSNLDLGSQGGILYADTS